MEFVKWSFDVFMTVTSISFLCCETADYDAYRIQKQFNTLEDNIYFIRKDITKLFEKTKQLNMSAVESCCPCISGNKTTCLPVTNHDGRQNMVEVNNQNVLVKCHSLIEAFVIEKKINRELQSRLHSMEDSFSESKSTANKKDREVQSRLQSVEDIISASEKVANERDREVHSRLQALEESIKGTLADIYRDLHNNITTFMPMISERTDRPLLKAEATSVKPDITTVPVRNCQTVPESGVYTLYLELIMSPATVYCDQDTDGGGWMVFMRRQDGSVSFARSWLEYKNGFGSPDGEFWAGNELLHKLTKERPMQLRIDMEDFDGNTAFAMYKEFQVGPEDDKYRLDVREYSGTAGDSLVDTGYVWYKHAGMQFTTFDSDNDKYSGNCAKGNEGGWWYNRCGYGKLNAPYSHTRKRQWPAILWHSWKGYDESLKRVEMKIR